MNYLKIALLSFASVAVMSMALRDASAQTQNQFGTQVQNTNSTSNANSNAGASAGSNSGSTASTGNTNSTLNYNAGNNSPTTVNNPSHTSSDNILRTAPTVYVPNVVTGNVCGLGASAGASWLGAGFGVGASWESQQCERRQQAALLHNAGYKQASRELMCDQREIYDAMKRGGTPCLPRPAWDGPVAAQPAPQPMPIAPPPVVAPAPMVQAPQQPVPRCNPRRGINDNCYSG